jgi:hypothetical protein
MRILSQEPMASGGQRQERQDYKLSMPEEVQGSKSVYSRSKVRRDDAALLPRHPCFFPPLQGSRDLSEVQVAGALCSLGVGPVPESGLHWIGVRSHQQQRALLSPQFATDNVFGESKKQGVLTPVYDLLNAGPRHRFTVEGRIVSNCYGMMPPKLVLYALSGYGVKMSLKQATDYRNKYFERFAGLARWHGRAQRDGQRQKASWSLAGRLRYLDTGDFYNEFYNNPVQGTGADGLKAALRCTYNRFKKLIGRPPTRIQGLPTPTVQMIHHVHDEIVAEAKDDKEFVEVVKHELEKGMKEGMQPLLKKVPVDVEASSGLTWADKS